MTLSGVSAVVLSDTVADAMTSVLMPDEKCGDGHQTFCGPSDEITYSINEKRSGGGPMVM
jgi:hypothetical protein